MSETTAQKDNEQEVDAAERQHTQEQKEQLKHELEHAHKAHGQARETYQGYARLGPVYASNTPIANAIGVEIGIVTSSGKRKTVQRTGFGIYLRSDHLCNKVYCDGGVPRP